MSLLSKSYSYAYANCIPLTATIELTQNCNFACKHCYNFDRQTHSKPLHPKSEELSLEQYLACIDSLANLGSLVINFSGGEATLSTDLPALIKRCQDLHLQARLKTNASLLSDKKLKEYSELGLKGIDVSIYGYSEKVYREFTGKTGQFEIVKKNIINAKKYHMEVIASIILHRNNVDELEQIINFCTDNEVAYNISTEVTARYDNSQSSRNEELTIEQYKELLNSKYSHFFNTKNEDENLQCSCARSVIGISCTGEVYPCIGAPVYSGSVKEDSLESIWKNSKELIKIRNLKKDDFKECSTCEFIKSCSRSSGSIFANTGNYTGCDTSTLEQAKLVHLSSKKNP